MIRIRFDEDGMTIEVQRRTTRREYHFIRFDSILDVIIMQVVADVIENVIEIETTNGKISLIGDGTDVIIDNINIAKDYERYKEHQQLFDRPIFALFEVITKYVNLWNQTTKYGRKQPVEVSA